jgi:outer membrane protein OmpA-like peptidoglycan-associated protein
MRLLPLASLLVAVATQASVPPAAAQVTSSDQSIDALKPPPAAKKKSAAPAAKAGAKTAHSPHKTTHTRTQPAAPAAKSALDVPAAPPAHPVIAPPPLVLPTHPPPPPPPVPVLPHAAGAATPLAGGTMVTFGPGHAELNPDTLAAIRAIGADALANPAIIIGITAWAPGTKDDPSTPRRLSLDRALAARAVLINAGIPSERIRAIAKGMNDIGTAAPDRAEIVKILPPPTKP